MASENISLNQGDLDEYLAAAVNRGRDLNETLTAALGEYATAAFNTDKDAKRQAQQRVGAGRIALDDVSCQIDDLNRWGARLRARTE